MDFIKLLSTEAEYLTMILGKTSLPFILVGQLFFTSSNDNNLTIKLEPISNNNIKNIYGFQ